MTDPNHIVQLSMSIRRRRPLFADGNTLGPERLAFGFRAYHVQTNHRDANDRLAVAVRGSRLVRNNEACAARLLNSGIAFDILKDQSGDRWLGFARDDVQDAIDVMVESARNRGKTENFFVDRGWQVAIGNHKGNRFLRTRRILAVSSVLVITIGFAFVQLARPSASIEPIAAQARDASGVIAIKADRCPTVEQVQSHLEGLVFADLNNSVLPPEFEGVGFSPLMNISVIGGAASARVSSTCRLRKPPEQITFVVSLSKTDEAWVVISARNTSTEHETG